MFLSDHHFLHVNSFFLFKTRDKYLCHRKICNDIERFYDGKQVSKEEEKKINQKNNFLPTLILKRYEATPKSAT